MLPMRAQKTVKEPLPDVKEPFKYSSHSHISWFFTILKDHPITFTLCGLEKVLHTHTLHLRSGSCDVRDFRKLVKKHYII